MFDFDTVGFTFNFDGSEADKDAYGKYQMAVTAVTRSGERRFSLQRILRW